MRSRFHGFLGGNWDFKSSSSPIHLLDEVAAIRHRYLHAGIEPTFSDADMALEAYTEVSEFAKDRLAIKKYEFPRTTALIMGEPGLRRKDAWTRRYQKLIYELANEDNWLKSFSQWVEPS